MCRNCSHTPPLNIAAHGLTSTTAPSRIVKPAGLFIHALTDTTQNVPMTPDAPIGINIAKCRRGAIRSQPYR